MVTKIPLVNYSGTIKEIAPSDTIAASYVGLGSVTNNAQTKAAIVPNTTPAAGNLLVGNAGGTAYASVAASGDATIVSTGAITVKPHIDVFLVAGQSNADGRGASAQSPVPMTGTALQYKGGTLSAEYSK